MGSTSMSPGDLCADCAPDDWERKEYHAMLPGFCTGCGKNVLNGDLFGVNPDEGSADA